MKVESLDVNGVNDTIKRRDVAFWLSVLDVVGLQETHVRCGCDGREWQLGWTEKIGNLVMFGRGICRKGKGRSYNIDFSKNEREDDRF